MTFQERRTALSTLPQRDKRILELARSVSNNLIFASQNSGRLAEERYQMKAEEALTNLEDLLLAEKKAGCL